MDNTVGSQAYIFFTTLYGGIVIGFVYDIYRIFRYFFKPKKVATFIEDLVFWLIVSVIALFILFFSSWGELRGFIFLGFVSGAFIYSKFLSKIVITILVYIIRCLLKALKYVYSTLTYPLRKLGHTLYTPYKKFRKKSEDRYRRIKKILRIPSKVFQDIKKYTKTILLKK